MPIAGSRSKEYLGGSITRLVQLLPNTEPLYRQINDITSELADSIGDLSQIVKTQSTAISSSKQSNFNGLLFNDYPIISNTTGTVGKLIMDNEGIGVYASSALYTIMKADGLSAIGGKIYGSYVEAMSGFFGSSSAGFFISGNELISGTAGQLYSTGKTSFSSATNGFFLGYDSSLTSYTFGIGNLTSYLWYNGSSIIMAGNVSISGAITAVSGTIGGWTIGTSGLSSGTTYINSGGTLRIKAGNNFFVDLNGNVTANNIALSGSITSSQGLIGGWNIYNGGLSSNDVLIKSTGRIQLGSDVNVLVLDATDTYRMWAGAVTPEVAPFSVDEGGTLVANNANIRGNISADNGYFSGSITSRSGYIGGWNINNQYLSTTGGSVYLGSISALNSSTTYGLNNLIQNPTFESGTGNYVYSSTGTTSLTAYSDFNVDDGLGYQLNTDIVSMVLGGEHLITFYQALTGSYTLNDVVFFSVDYLDRTHVGCYSSYIELLLINNSTVITSYTADLQSTVGIYDFSTFNFTTILPSSYAGLTAQVKAYYLTGEPNATPYNYSFKNVILTRVSSPISYYTDKGFHIYNETSELKYSSMGLIINNNNPSYLYTVSSENTYTNHITTTNSIITKRLPTLTFTDTTPSGSLISSNYGLGKLDYYNYNISQQSLAYIQTKLVNRLTSPSIERKTKFDFYTVTGGTTDTAPSWQLSVGDYTLSGVNAKFNGSVCANNIYLGTSHSISSNNEVVNLKTRSELLYNYFGDINRNASAGLTSVSQFTSISSGYGMVRSGRITGYSLSYYLTLAPDTGTSNVGILIYKNGILQSSTTANITNGATYPLQYSLTGTLTSSISFNSNDVINAQVTLLGSHSEGTCTITNPGSIVEILI